VFAIRAVDHVADLLRASLLERHVRRRIVKPKRGLT
jgi:hypothetical protein